MRDESLAVIESELARSFARSTTDGSEDVYGDIMKLKVCEVQTESHSGLLEILGQHASFTCSLLGLENIESISSIRLKIFDDLEVLGVYVTDNLGNNYRVAKHSDGFHLKNSESLGFYPVAWGDNKSNYKNICADFSRLSNVISDLLPLLEG
ncbi:hypothetical protein ACFLY9_01810 [Patescibacteria group bacterium]